MHSEECPVCHGSGKYIDQFASPEISMEKRTRPCHGCAGKGWIMVADAVDMEMMMKNPAMAKLMGLDKFEHKGGNKKDRKQY